MRHALAFRDMPSTRWESSRAGSSELSPTFPVMAGVALPMVSPPTTQRPAWVDEIEARLEQLRGLKANWDNRNSAEIRADALAFVVSMLPEIMLPNTPAPAINPLGHGGVQLSWESGLAELDVEVRAPNDVVIYFLNKQTQADDEWGEATDFRRLAGIIEREFRG